MQILNDIIDQVASSGIDSMPYMESLAILCKNMPIYDEGLPAYINEINWLHENGLNTPSIRFHQLLPNTTRSYKNGMLHSTTGVFVEDRAMGFSFGKLKDIHLSSEGEIPAEEIAKEYYEQIKTYLEELERRVKAPQLFYDTLARDILALQTRNIDEDLNASKFFFDPQLGYTMIDLVPSRKSGKESLPTILNCAIYGNGLPKLFLDTYDLSVVTSSFKERLDNCFNVLFSKICLSLIKVGIPMEEIEDSFRQNLRNFSLKEVDDFSEIPIQILEKQAEITGNKAPLEKFDLLNLLN